MDRNIERLENNIYALNLAYDKLKKSINDKIEPDIYASIGELLLWVLTTDEWHSVHNNGYNDRKKFDEEGQILFGLKHAYNLMKHNMNFYKIHREEGGISFPISFPLVIPEMKVVWESLVSDKNCKFKNQEKNYKTYIENRTVIEVFDKAIKYLKKETINVKKELD